MRLPLPLPPKIFQLSLQRLFNSVAWRLGRASGWWFTFVDSAASLSFVIFVQLFCSVSLLSKISLPSQVLHTFNMMSQTEVLTLSEADTKFFADNLLGVEDWGTSAFCCISTEVLLGSQERLILFIVYFFRWFDCRHKVWPRWIAYGKPGARHCRKFVHGNTKPTRHTQSMEFLNSDGSRREPLIRTSENRST